MVEVNQTEGELTRPARYQPVDGDPPFECLGLRTFRWQVGPGILFRHKRIQFDLVIAPTQGRGTHIVDFTPVNLDRNHWLHIRPGQTHRFVRSNFEADLILFQPISAAPREPGPRTLQFTDDQLDNLAPLLNFIKIDRGGRGDRRVMSVTRALLIEQLKLDARPANHQPLCEEFQRLVEMRVTELRSVSDYAALLSCSTRDLAHACRRSRAGEPQKIIDQALLLEAKRLLSQQNATVANVASFLDFGEASFVRFFKRTNGQRLTDWVDEHLQ